MKYVYSFIHSVPVLSNRQGGPTSTKSFVFQLFSKNVFCILALIAKVILKSNSITLKMLFVFSK